MEWRTPRNLLVPCGRTCTAAATTLRHADGTVPEQPVRLAAWVGGHTSPLADAGTCRIKEFLVETEPESPKDRPAAWPEPCALQSRQSQVSPRPLRVLRVEERSSLPVGRARAGSGCPWILHQQIPARPQDAVSPGRPSPRLQ